MSKQNKQKGIDMIIGKEVVFELFQTIPEIDYNHLETGIEFGSVQNFFKTLGKNYWEKSAGDKLLPYELRRVVKLYNMNDMIHKEGNIRKYGDESKVPLHNDFGLLGERDNFRLIDSYVTQRCSLFVRNSSDCVCSFVDRTQFLYRVAWHYFDSLDNAYVINPSGYQLWPELHKKKYPDIVKQILSNKKEEINIRSF